MNKSSFAVTVFERGHASLNVARGLARRAPSTVQRIVYLQRHVVMDRLDDLAEMVTLGDTSRPEIVAPGDNNMALAIQDTLTYSPWPQRAACVLRAVVLQHPCTWTPPTVIQRTLTMSDDERAMYQILQKRCQNVIHRLLRTEHNLPDIMRVVASALQMAVGGYVDPVLSGDDDVRATAASDEQQPPPPPPDCSICRSEMVFMPTRVTCGHVFCHPCIDTWLAGKQTSAATCPMCRAQVTIRQLDAGNLLMFQDLPAPRPIGCKLRAMYDVCLEARAAQQKVVVFTQFELMAAAFAEVLNTSLGANCMFCQEGMDAEDVVRSVDRFNACSGFQACVITPRIAVDCLELTGVCTVVFCEPLDDSELRTSVVRVVNGVAGARIYNMGVADTVDDASLCVSVASPAAIAELFRTD